MSGVPVHPRRADLRLERLPGRLAICRLAADDPIPPWAREGSPLVSITRTDRELSIVAAEDAVPESVRAERGWIALRIVGTLDFSLIGIVSALTGALAEAKVPVFVLSTHDTDILLVRAGDAQRAEAALSHVAYIADAQLMRRDDRAR
jgi:hypothetical protein